MKNQKKIAVYIRWIARIWGSLVLAFVLFFMVAHLFGAEESGEGFRNTTEVLTFIFFPISSVLGLFIALKWEGLGGLIIIGGIIGLFIMRFDLISNLYFTAGLIPPGILFIFYWYLSKGKLGAHSMRLIEEA